MQRLRRNGESYNQRLQQISAKNIILDTTGRGKVIHWELCKKFKSDHGNKRYMHNPESVQKNETDRLILARRSDLVKLKIKKKI